MAAVGAPRGAGLWSAVRRPCGRQLFETRARLGARGVWEDLRVRRAPKDPRDERDPELHMRHASVK